MDLDWYTIDMESIVEGKAVQLPDLSDVVEIGYTDLMPGGQSNACSRLDWIEVYAYLAWMQVAYQDAWSHGISIA